MMDLSDSSASAQTYMTTDTNSSSFDETNADLLAIDLYSPIICNQQLLTINTNNNNNNNKSYYDTTTTNNNNGQEFNLLGFDNSFLVQNNLINYETNTSNEYKWKRYSSNENLLDLNSTSYYTNQTQFNNDQTALINIDSNIMDLDSSITTNLKCYKQTSN